MDHHSAARRTHRHRRAGADPLIIRTVAQTGSTNADLLADVTAGQAIDGGWLRAEQQSAGRGRDGRVWISRPGNLYASGSYRSRPGDPAPSTMALVAGLAVHDVLAATGLQPVLKWPNDVLIDNAKLAGILIQRAHDWFVVGVGINLAHSPELHDRAVTSVQAHGVTLAPAAAASALADRMAARLAQWRGPRGLESTRDDWLARAHPPGSLLRINLPNGEIVAGRFIGLDAYGALRIATETVPERNISTGDVFVDTD